MMKLNWGKIIVIFVALVFVIGLIVAVANGGNSNSTPKGKAEIIVNGDVGVTNIIVTNQNIPGGSMTVPASELPFSFLCSKSDRIVLNATLLGDYEWNAWRFQNRTFINRNPITFTVSGDLEITADCLIRSDYP